MKIDNAKKKFILILIGVSGFLYIIFKLVTTGSVDGVILGLMGLLRWGIFLGIIGAIIYFLVFYQKKINVLVETRKKLIDACLVNSVEGMGDLITEGDEKHISKQYGSIIGYCQIPTSKQTETGYEFAHVFLVRIFGNGYVNKLKSFFSSGVLFIVPDDMADELTGDIYVKCNSFIKYADSWYPNNCYMDYNLLDKTVYNEADRYAKTEYMAHIATQINKASGIDRSDEQKVEGKSGFAIVKEIKGDNNSSSEDKK